MEKKIKVFGCKSFCFVPKEDKNGKLFQKHKNGNDGLHRKWLFTLVSAGNVIFDEK